MIFNRYPHTGTIIISEETDNSSGIPGVSETEIEVQGRYEPLGQSKAMDYSAKFYCPVLNISPFQIDGQKFVYQGKQFTIVQLHNYQSHCELWLE